MSSDGFFDGIPDDEKPALLERLPYALRVAELIREPGALDHWRKRCHESFLESQERRKNRDVWNERRAPFFYAARIRSTTETTEQAILNWINEGNPCIGEDFEQDFKVPKGWRAACERLPLPDGVTETVWTFLPPDLADDKEPYTGGPLPLSPRHPLSLADCYFILALIHDAERRDAAKINPFHLDDERSTPDHEAIFWAAEAIHVFGFNVRDRMTLDDCVARVELDLSAKLQRSLSAGAKNAEPGQSEPAYQIRLVGEVWHLRYRDERGDYPAKGHQCLTWLAKLLAMPNRMMSVANVRGDPEGKIAADATLGAMAETDQEGIAGIHRRIEEIDFVLKETGGSESLEDEKISLLRRLQNFGNQVDSQLKRDHANIATQIRGFVKKLKTDMPELAAHLNEYLKRDYPEFGYYPPNPAPNWQI